MSEFSRRIRRDFFEQIPTINKTLKQVADNFLNATDPQDRAARLEMLSRKMGFLTHMTSMAGCYRIAQLASAFEALLYELQEKPSNVNESSLHTVRRTVELLEQCLSRADQVDEQCLSPTSILVVDDDAVSNRALVLALGRHRLTVTSLTDPFAAFEKLKTERFDLLLLDINMPGMDGLELCRRIREMPQHANTVVVFFTSHLEFEPRARAILHRGDDLITKPILPIELTVKIVSNFIKRRIENASPSSIEV
jgi:CheY-like chemotaxis protein